MSVVTLQLGQCGNQLGAELFSALHQESQAAPYSLSNHIQKTFFCERAIRGSDAKAKCARAVLVDTEPRVVQRCIEGIEGDAQRAWRYAPRGVYHAGGAANNWACGYNVHGPALQEKVLEELQKEVEGCDRLGGFLALHSVAGGTGSGLGSCMLRAVRDTFPSSVLSSVSVWPFEGGEVSVQCYNAALTLGSIYEHTDMAVVCENQRYLDLCRVLLGQERPSLDSLNHAICRNLVRVMMPCKSVRNLHGSGSPLLQLAGHLCAHPRALPQMVQGAEAFTSDSWTALQRQLLNLSETGSSVDRPSGQEVKGRCRTVSGWGSTTRLPHSSGEMVPPKRPWTLGANCHCGSTPSTACRSMLTRTRLEAWSGAWAFSATAKPWCQLYAAPLVEPHPCCALRPTCISTSAMA
ncbi:unnamed protein product [Effrenium voratum]|uniref:Tubulin delta chain n=1 Tax=Effrenium voratum TaxID=2562239 RepID=A0AA36ILK1_9DINO|nr:unnamed protein product [Effrenium voratum]